MVLDKKALNIEMLKIAGFTCTGGIWSYPDGIDVDDGVPFFPESVDECFKWLVPKIWSLHYIIFDQSGVLLSQHKTAETKATVTRGRGEPALAFCLAVKELTK